MVKRELAPRRGYYFALPRLCALLGGGDAKRSENNWLEAYFGGVAVFLISYVTLLAQFHAGLLVAFALLFATWLAWLAVLHLNSLIVHALRRGGMFVRLTNSRAQNVIIGVETTACAVALTMRPQCSLIGWVWLLIVAVNSAAAVALRLADQHDA